MSYKVALKKYDKSVKKKCDKSWDFWNYKFIVMMAKVKLYTLID